MKKYKNKDGIELSFTGNDTTSVLVREVISEAIRLCDAQHRWEPLSMEFALSKTKSFLQENFNIEDNTDGR